MLVPCKLTKDKLDSILLHFDWSSKSSRIETRVATKIKVKNFNQKTILNLESTKERPNKKRRRH